MRNTRLAFCLCVALLAAGSCGWAAKAAPAKPAARHASPMAEHSGFKVPSAQPERALPISVTLSPDGTRLAVVSMADLLVRDLRSNRWIRNFGEAYSVAARWHPTKPVLVAADGSADQPDYYLAYLSSGKRRQVFRGDARTVAWTNAGLLAQSAGNVDIVIVTVDLNKARVTKSGNFGHKMPWYMYPKAFVRYMSPAGPNDQVAAEVESMEHGRRGPMPWLETYRRVPGRRQWVRSGKIEGEIRGKTVIWYPRNPNWLGDGRLAYLRIFPAQWVSFQTGSNNWLNPKASTARNRAELWFCDATGANQKKITTIWDLRPYVMVYRTDWMTIDRQGRNVYYLSGEEIRHLHLAGRDR